MIVVNFASVFRKFLSKPIDWACKVEICRKTGSVN